VAEQWSDVSAALYPDLSDQETYGARKVFYIGFYAALITMNDFEPLNKELNNKRIEIEDFMAKALEAECSLEDLKISEVSH